jgi:citrate lyase subunit beta/citryl-CoA lyase
VRVNGVGTPTFAGEVTALTELAARPGHGLLGLMVPKCEDAETLARLARALQESVPEPLALVALVESARGVTTVEILAQVRGLTRLAFGAIDLSVDLDCGPDSTTVRYARSRLVIASRAAGLVSPLGSPSTAIRDLDAVTTEADSARADGCGGMLCIHPAQLDPVVRAFTPTADEVAWAERIATAGDSAVQVDHQMIDRPVLERARRILRVAPARPEVAHAREKSR